MNRGNTAKVLNAIKMASEPITRHKVALRSGMDDAVAGRIITRLLGQKRITKHKVQGSLATYGMTDDQRQMVGNLVVIMTERRVGLDLDPVAAIERKRYLESLKKRPAFVGVAVIDAMIADYAAAHERASKAESQRRRRAAR